jgi:glutamate-1-semialdehyde 2,1-aminomutase
VILEPLPANYGLLPQRDAFVTSLVRLARKHGCLVIFDEVISGFRVALGGMAERLNIEPDLVTYGKVIGGGFPVGAYGGRRELMELVAPVGPVYQAGTLSANPVAIAAGFATLRKLEANPPYEALERRARETAQAIEKAAASRGDDSVRVQTDGSLFWIVLDVDSKRATPIRSVATIPAAHRARFARLFHALLERGVYLAPSGFEVGFLSTAHTDADLEQFLAAFEGALPAGRGS